MKRAQVAPAKPPPTTTTRPRAPWAIAGMGSSAAEAPAAAFLRKSRRLVDLRHGRLPQSFCAPYQAAMALISSSEKPLAMRPITVPGSWPGLEALHRGHDRRRIAADEPRHRGVGYSGRRMAARARCRPRRRVGRPGGQSRSDRRQEEDCGSQQARAGHVEALRRRRPPIGRSNSDVLQVVVLQRQRANALPVAAKIVLHSAGAAAATGGRRSRPAAAPGL